MIGKKPPFRCRVVQHSSNLLVQFIIGIWTDITSIIGGKAYHWDQKYTFVVPSWTWLEHRATRLRPSIRGLIQQLSLEEATLADER